jgi:hypothetical protein
MYASLVGNPASLVGNPAGRPLARGISFPGDLEPEAWAAPRRVLDLIKAAKVEGDPQTVFQMIEEDLRARVATPVESK